MAAVPAKRGMAYETLTGVPRQAMEWQRRDIDALDQNKSAIVGAAANRFRRYACTRS